MTVLFIDTSAILVKQSSYTNCDAIAINGLQEMKRKVCIAFCDILSNKISHTHTHTHTHDHVNIINMYRKHKPKVLQKQKYIHVHFEYLSINYTSRYLNL